MSPSGRLSSLSRSARGARALVTGAASGMGRATAHVFADEGATVAVVDRDAEGVVGVVEEIRAVHGTSAVVGLVTDLSHAAEIPGLVDEVAATIGGVDVLVNNAGVSLVSSAFQDDDAFEAAWAYTLEVNLAAQVRLIRHCLPHLRAAPNGGRVVNVASTEAIVTTAGLAAYAASKSAVVGITKSFAVELGRHGITVNCVCPGPILTGMTEAIPDEAKDSYARRRVPLRRYGQPEEVAHMILNLALPASSFVNGAVVTVDGGMTVRHT